MICLVDFNLCLFSYSLEANVPMACLTEEAVRLQRAQLAARLALLSASVILTLHVSNLRPGAKALSGIEAGKAAKAAGKDAKAVASAVKAASAKASKAEEEQKKERSRLITAHQEVSNALNFIITAR